MRRRDFSSLPLLGLLAPGWGKAADVVPVRFRKAAAYQSMEKLIAAGSDEFTIEREAIEMEAGLRADLAAGRLPVGKDSGRIKSARFYALSKQRARFEISSVDQAGAIEYRTGELEIRWAGDKIAGARVIHESVARARQPLFRDVTVAAMGRLPAFRDQLSKGTPYWRARLDAASGIDVYGTNGIAVGDVDNDGVDEVYVCQPGGLPNRLLKLGADGQFVDWTDPATTGVLDNTSSALFADFRNCGLQDLVVLTANGPLYFVNEGVSRGGAKFRLAPDAFRFKRAPSGTFTGMAAADYDRDGKLDLYLCTYIYFQNEDQYRYPVPYHDAQHGPPNILLRNRSASVNEVVFEDVTVESGIDENNNKYSFAAAWCDYDSDGFPELFVANDFGRKNLYKFDGKRFRDVAQVAGVEDIGPGMSAAWFDYDGDGRLDLYVANMWSPSGQRVSESAEFGPVKNGASRQAYHGHTKGNSLYRNSGDGKFASAGSIERAEMGRWAWSSDGFDFDLDGTPEIFVTAGMITNKVAEGGKPKPDLMSFFWRQTVSKSPATAVPTPAYEAGWNAINQWIREDYSWNGNEPNVFYKREDGRFVDYSGVSGLDFADDSRAFAVTDLSGNGSLDILLKSRNGPQVRVLENHSSAGRNAIAVDLVGVKSNRDAIGANVTVEWGGGRQAAQQVSAGSGFLSQHTKRLHFGLGELSEAAKVTVRWPSGETQEFANWKAGFRYAVTEGSTEARSVPFSKRRAPVTAVASSANGENTPKLVPTWLLEPVPLPDKQPGPGFVLLVHGHPRAAHSPAGLPWQVIDLAQAPPETVAGFAIFRRYLLDWRGPLTVPFLLLVDGQSRVHKIYPEVPVAAALKADLRRLTEGGDRLRLALPFPGSYYLYKPSRNYHRFGGAFLASGYPDFARPYLEEAIRVWPENAKAHATLGQLHLEAGRLEEASRHLNRAAAIQPNTPEVWNNLGGVAMSRGRYEEAAAFFEKGIAINGSLGYLLANAGEAAARLNRLDPAEQLYRRAIAIEPNDADTLDRLGILLARQNRFPEAKELFQKAITIDGAHASAINNLAVLYLELGQATDALAALEFGVRQAPSSETLHMNLARLYVQRGQRDRARDLLGAFVQHNPNAETAKKALGQLQ